jgi:hypothetical protein
MVKFICVSNSETLYISGNIEELGNWSQNLPMIRRAGHFEINIDIFPGIVLEYKYGKSPVILETCGNHFVPIFSNSICITNIWNQAEMVVDTIEDYIPSTNICTIWSGNLL